MIKPVEINYQSYAMTDDKSRGRLTVERFDENDFRSQFQHDRDRIIHSKAFRRLESKTQVVISHESDHNRKRLTHSLEVMQMADSIAYALGVNLFLTQAIALGHDLGHAPFGHGGERALSAILLSHNLAGYQHNCQSLLIANQLERSYRETGGLNLMVETRDGILKHTSIKDDNKIRIDYYDNQVDQVRKYPITIEGQIVRIVDEIAQRTHDTDDGLRSDRIDINDLLGQPIMKLITEAMLVSCGLTRDAILERYKKERVETISKIIVAMIKFYVINVIKTSMENINEMSIKTVEDVQASDSLIVKLAPKLSDSDEMFQKQFLRPHFYSHYEVKRMDARGDYFIGQLFKAFKKNPRQLPEREYQDYEKAAKKDMDRNDIGGDSMCVEKGCAYKVVTEDMDETTSFSCPMQKKLGRACEGVRAIVNYIAGMTDRHANLEYSRLYLPPEISRM